MLNAKATDVKNKFGEFLDISINEPVSINKNGRVVAVLLSHREYEHLIVLEDAYWRTRALKAEESGWVGSETAIELLNEMNEEHAKS